MSTCTTIIYEAVVGTVSATVLNAALVAQGCTSPTPGAPCNVLVGCCGGTQRWPFVFHPEGCAISKDARKANFKTVRNITKHMRAVHGSDARVQPPQPRARVSGTSHKSKTHTATAAANPQAGPLAAPAADRLGVGQVEIESEAFKLGAKVPDRRLHQVLAGPRRANQVTATAAAAARRDQRQCDDSHAAEPEGRSWRLQCTETRSLMDKYHELNGLYYDSMYQKLLLPGFGYACEHRLLQSAWLIAKRDHFLSHAARNETIILKGDLPRLVARFATPTATCRHCLPTPAIIIAEEVEVDNNAMD